MYKYLSKITFIVLLTLLSGCKDIVEIKGNSEVYTSHTYTYTADIVNPEIANPDIYKWFITPKKNVELIDADKKNVQIRILKEGSYKLHLLVEIDGKKFPSHIDIKAIKPIYIDGFLLPHEVDETLNNSTLLGIDDNNNSIRDDVERWILLDMEFNPGHSKAERAIALQLAKAFQMTLSNPTNIDDKPTQALHEAIECQAYYMYVKYDNILDDFMIIKQGKLMKDITFNTKERLKTYWSYDATLGGRVFTLNLLEDGINQCNETVLSIINEEK